MGYYKDRSYRGILDTYEHANNDGPVATTLSVSKNNIKEINRYNNLRNGWIPDNLTKMELHPSDSIANTKPKAGGAKGVITDRDFQGLQIANLDAIINNINDSFGIENNNDTLKSAIKREMKKYNRFKIPELNLQMSRCYGHVFFTRPSCNVLTSDRELCEDIQNHPNFLYANNTCKGLLEELTKYGPSGCGNEFNMLLSNNSKGFALNDETLQTTTYGTTFSGYKVSFGKDDIESKTAGEFSTTFIDDKRIHNYRYIKLWVEYITGVYRGKIIPLEENELNKIIDYTSSVYYILTAEDGETILFWSKYFGVYPTTIPSSQYSWQHGENLTPNEIQVSFAYSWKQDFDPRDLIAFNYNAKMTTQDYTYTRVFDSDLLMPGPIWVGTPFIEFVDDGVNEPSYKLRFGK